MILQFERTTIKAAFKDDETADEKKPYEKSILSKSINVMAFSSSLKNLKNPLP